jgi:four helix bundle protein
MSGADNPWDLKKRLVKYSLRIIKMYSSLPKDSKVAMVIGHQVLRSGTSPGAHHREALRARSDREFVSKMEGGLQELEETDYWLELIVESGIMSKDIMRDLIAETDELISIFVASVKKVKQRREKS